MTGSEILIEGLKREGVEVIFGYPGGSVLPLCDHLYDCGLRFILVRHEQGAAHAADGYARASGRVGVCLATSGPGATNLVTGIATAYMDSIPVVAITGQVATHLIGNDAFQEVDTTGITRPITKHNYLVNDVRDLPRIIKEAFHIASTGRPGPVLIDLPVDVQRAEGKPLFPEKVEIRSYRPTYQGHPLQLEKAWKTIRQARQPVIMAGGGIILADASEPLRAFAEKTSIPVTFTLMGLGSLPVNHPLSLGMLGMHGTRYANYAVMESDLLIAMGCRFDDRVTGKLDQFAPRAKIIHIDIDPSAISKNVEVDIPIVGHVKKVLEQLNEVAEPIPLKEWLDKINQWKKQYPISYERNGLKPQKVIEEISRLTDGEAIICTEVGQNQMWTAQFYQFQKPRTLITSGGLGTMGFGF
ncbi:MAG TPA: biosynthetic-type acetolactate synthase large subunit, partial [bacterium]|nr:biosynthetic-type acetolactate synthase large subunit [bacterium]